MPQLTLFRRRWRVASDTLPVLAMFLALFHIAIIVPIIAITVMTESGSYECYQKTLVQAALFGPMITYVVCIVNEVIILALGLQGGPLEERKRRIMRPFIYIEIILWLVIIGMTAWATYVGYDPAIGAACWSNNPCDTIRETIPSSCTANQDGDVELTPACQVVVSAEATYADQCIIEWSDYAATWMVNHYNASRWPNYFNPPYPGEIITCNDSISASSVEFQNWYATHVPGSNVDSRQADRFTAAFEAQVLAQLGILHTPVVPALDAPWRVCFEQECLLLLAAGDNCSDWKAILDRPSSVYRKNAFLASLFASWGMIFITGLIVFLAFNTFPDYDKSESWEHMVRSISRCFCCSSVLENAETATGEAASKEIGRLLHILFGGIDLDPTDQFLGMFLVAERQRWRRQRHVLKALETAGITRVPTSVGWVRRLDAFLRRLLAFRVRIKFVNRFARKKTEKKDGVDDIDKNVVLTSTLEDSSGGDSGDHDDNSHGDDGNGVPQLHPIEEGSEEKRESENVSRQQSMNGDDIIIQERDSNNNTGGGGGGGGGDNGIDDITTTTSTTTDITTIDNNHNNNNTTTTTTAIPSPFDAEVAVVKDSTTTTTTANTTTTTNDNASALASTSTKNKVSFNNNISPASRRRFLWRSPSHQSSNDMNTIYKPPKIAHSFVRLISMKSSNNDQDLFHISETATTHNSSFADSSTSGTESTAVERSSQSRIPMSYTALGKKLIMDDKPRPLLTPFVLKNIALNPAISSYDAAKVYNGQMITPVDKHELADALEYSRLARAAYGLQSVRWNGAVPDSRCGQAVDSLLSCCAPLSTALRMKDHFKKRNFQAILDITQCNVEDLLYVSYASAAFGVLPYMVLLHKQSRSVVLSIRGTVGFEDLITDLLSNPVDATDSLPEWAVREAMHEHAMKSGKESEPNLYAHAGILSSTTAVLKDLEEQGLLQSMREAYHHSEGSGALPDNPQEGKVEKALRLTRDTTLRLMEHMQSIDSNDEVELDLERAQSVLNAAIVGSGWRFVVVGHSLGAAVACMVSFHLREHFPTLQCYAYCPPGGLLSDPLSKIARRFCTSIVVGFDPISRLGLPTTQRVVDEMVLALARCKRPKLVILYDYLLGRRNDPESAPRTFCAFKDVGVEARAALQNYLATSRLHSVGLDTRELYPPGRILYLRPFTVPVPKRKKMFTEVWDAVWVSAKDVIDEGIILTLSMTRHHRMPTLESALESAINDEAAKSSILNTLPTPIPSEEGPVVVADAV